MLFKLVSASKEEKNDVISLRTSWNEILSLAANEHLSSFDQCTTLTL